MSETEASAPAPSAEAEWQRLADVDLTSAEFPLRARCGDDAILVLRLGSGFRGIERACPHQKRPLNDAILQGGDKMIRCRWHSYVFRLSDGKAAFCQSSRVVHSMRSSASRTWIPVTI